MKKIFTLILVAVATMVAVPASAQVQFGLKGGLNVTNMSLNDDILKTENRAGFFIGPTVKFTLPIVGLGVDASALYDQREGEVVEGNNKETLKAQSIQIPINLRYGIGLGSVAEVFAFAGPQFGFNIGSNKKFEDIKQEWTLKSSNLSANVGLGLTVLSKLQAKINYNFALGKTGEVTPLEGAKQVFNGSAKINTWQMSLAYFF